ncbi:MAG: DUF6705 family protein [Chitinophagaceae bacterium]
MKQSIIIIAIFTFSIIKIQAQTPKPGEYRINNSLLKFEGSWIWFNGTDTLKLVLKKEKLHQPPGFAFNFYFDAIVGWYLYKKGNIIIENSLSFANTSYYDGHSSILGGNKNGKETLEGNIKDSKKNKFAAITLTLNASHTSLHWKLNNNEGVRIGKYDHGFSLPKTGILAKE